MMFVGRMGEIHRRWPHLLLTKAGCNGGKCPEHVGNNGVKWRGDGKALEAHRHRHRWPKFFFTIDEKDV
jgi:hypothetical protein